jgi:hypothetical protein
MNQVLPALGHEQPNAIVIIGGEGKIHQNVSSALHKLPLPPFLFSVNVVISRPK